ncbi:MAG: bifunctional nuclease family protein [Candidatus Rokubacteria bacterium]|nr:bifunctional nuclease family protein [Candidatus Rokubacteria bacterium]
MTGRWRMTGAGVLIAVALLLAGAKEQGTGEGQPPAPSGPQEAEVVGVVLDRQTQQPMVVLQGKRDKRHLAMVIGFFEANGIAIPLQGVTPPRPLTYDLLLTLLGNLKTSLKRVIITDLRDDIYYATLFLDAQGRELSVDSRPSDAIALALRARVPILIEDRVFDKADRLVPKPGPSPHF